MSEEIHERFFKRFASLNRAHGQWTPSGDTREDGKEKGRAEVVRHSPSAVLWQQHIAGKIGIGLFPLRDDGTCVWGDIDIDIYDLDHGLLERRIKTLQLPLIICRSKSGGAHCYLFTSEDCPATLMRGKLMEWAVALGYGGVEVFPKQTALADKKDVGNWLNMPYQDGKRSVRYAIENTKRLSMEAFLDLADQREVTIAELEAIEIETHDLLEDAPPCLVSLAQSGVPDGQRNQALYNFGVFVRLKYGDDDVVKHLDEMNHAFMDPPKGSAEVQKIAKSVNKKDYFYKCTDQPCVAVCNKQICLTKKFGVGQSPDDPGVEIGQIIRLNTDPVTWYVEVNSVRLEMGTEALMLQKKFQYIVLERLSILMVPIKAGHWAKMITAKLSEMEEEQAPDDAGPAGVLAMHLQDFCSSFSMARERDEVVQGKPWVDTKDGRTYFRSSDFQRYLAQQRVTGFDGRKLFVMLRRIKGCEHGQWNIKGQNVQWWSIASFPKLIDDTVEEDEIPF
jgi:hypothetical protein